MLQRNLLLILALSLSPGLSLAESAPDYALRDIDGNLHRASDHRGRWLINNFWATWCAPCIREMPELEKFYTEYRAQAVVWGVSFEDTPKDELLAFVERTGVTYPILGYGQDPLTGFGRVRVLPTTFLINPDGLFHHRFEGPIQASQIVEVIRQE